MKHSKRYSRQVVLPEIGIIGQQKLLNAKVLVIGAGGLGCPVLQILAASGVGTLGVVDGDEVDMSNLHRQLLYMNEDCGKKRFKRLRMPLAESIQMSMLMYIQNLFQKVI